MGIMDENISRRYFANEKDSNEEPDRLAQEAAEALRLGMSYGKYKAKQYEKAKGKTAQPKQEQPDPRLKYDLVCKTCGVHFKSITPLRKYCSQECKNHMELQRAKEKRQKKLAEIEPLDTLPPMGAPYHDD